MTEALPQPTFTPGSLPTNEAERLKALRRYDILDTPPEVAFDRLTTLAARLFDVPIALVSLIDESRGWFKSCYGFDLCEVKRDATICSFALLYDDVLVIPDTRQDSRLVCNPFVQSEPGLRFYAGAPLITEDGFTLGTLCLLDTKPREVLTPEQTATLTDLAAMVIDELELRLAGHRIARIDAVLLEVTQGIAAATGEEFFYALVQHFAKVLEVDYVYIGLVTNSETETLNTIAVCAQGEIIDNFAYSLRDTPCQQVLQQKKLCCYPRDLKATFPHAPLLESLQVESYIAIPVCDAHGTAIGLLGIMHSKPLENIQIAESLLTIFALRIAAELARQQAERISQQAQSELENLVERRTIELSKTNELLRLEVTEKQKAKAALETEQEFLKALLNNVQAGIVSCDADGILTLFNRAAQAFHGLPEQPLPPEQWADYYDLYMPDGSTRMSKEDIPLFRALQEQTVDKIEMMIVPRHGTARTLLASGQAIADTQGNKQGAVVVMHDITERKQAEAELLISDAALQQMPDAILLTDLEGKIQRWLGNAEQIFGYTAAEAIGNPISFLYHATTQPMMTAEIIQSIEDSGEFCGEVSCQRKDGSEVPIETTAKMVYDKAGNPLFFISINKDITERKQAEAERAQLIREQTARSQAEAANRIKDEFLAVLSHELRTPLNPILGWAKLLRRGRLDEAKTAQALATIERNAKLQSELIEDLLDVSRILQGKLSLNAYPINLADTIRAAMETVRLAAEAKMIQVEVILDPEVRLVSGDSNRLQQVIWNLLSNAVKFSLQGGKVTLRLEQLEEQAQITISDTGRGIHPDFLPHVFDYFRQADGATTRKFGGLGLGLAIVHHLVELHGGTVTVESPGEGLGATFRVQLPLMPTSSKIPSRDRSPEQLCDLSNISILVVDDETDTRDFVAFLLEQSGAKVTAVACASDALIALTEFKPDLLLSDIGMPEIDGYMLMQQIRKLPSHQGGQIPAIALTAFAGEINHQQALSAGFQQHISKPVEPDNLIKVIATLLSSS
jgi:PAS domain S-box-containing protein